MVSLGVTAEKCAEWNRDVSRWKSKRDESAAWKADQTWHSDVPWHSSSFLTVYRLLIIHRKLMPQVRTSWSGKDHTEGSKFFV